MSVKVPGGYEHIEQKEGMVLWDEGDNDYRLTFKIWCWKCGAVNHPVIEMSPTKIEDFKQKK